MDQAIEPGGRVGIEFLSRSIGVSATPVCEALACLETDGLVVKRRSRATATPNCWSGEGWRSSSICGSFWSRGPSSGR
ncbi:DNA-binding FadR family transcriptional regulator [Streptomyces umbrinus]|uniref:DNA-binding FadR family transcriptional regulator n=1 Tax=Streptomyces umbrinus TaxID=67370 RepID=A0ABU0T7N5_9ACTN|nr:DNA-binding FadR family transcriptional regulator [Streptomyces umbrinus]